jgi:hypothetical protein
MTADVLMSRHTAALQAATVHPFLEPIGDWNQQREPRPTSGAALPIC